MDLKGLLQAEMDRRGHKQGDAVTAMRLGPNGQARVSAWMKGATPKSRAHILALMEYTRTSRSELGAAVLLTLMDRDPE